MSARIDVASDLLEAALLAWEHASDGTQLAREFQLEREAAYEAAAGPERVLAFTRLHERWSRRLDLAGPLERALARTRVARRELERVLVRRAASSREESAELWRGGGGARLVLYLLPRRLLEPARVESWAQCECLRAEDMLDPAFRYSPALPSEIEDDPAHADLVRDRLRVLWQARLVARSEALLGRSIERGRLTAALAALLESAPAPGDADLQQAAFERLAGSDWPAILELALNGRLPTLVRDAAG